MTPDTLAEILDANPYPGAVVTASHAVVSLTFDAFTLRYHADGWHVEALHLESLLNEYSAPEAVAAEIRRILKTVFTIKVGAALSDAEALGSVDPVEYLTDLAAEKMLSILDVAALANARQAKIASNVAEAAARDMRIADLERDLAAAHKQADANLKWGEAYKGALDLYFEKMGLNHPWSLERRMEHVAKVCGAWTALTRICEVIGAPVPCVAEDAVEAVKTLLCESEGHNARADRAEATLAEMVKALDDAGAPAVYTLADDTERPIADPERIRLLGERVRALRAQLRDASDSPHLSALIEANEALSALGAPRIAGDTTMSVAARIRAIPR